jgi:hypothetical protein
MCHQCTFAGLVREVSCLEFLRYCHSERNLLLNVIKSRGNNVGQSCLRSGGSAPPLHREACVSVPGDVL